MKIRCITISDYDNIPIPNEVIINDNKVYLDNNYPILNNEEISINNSNLTFVELDNNIFAISVKNQYTGEKIKGFELTFNKNINLRNIDLWGDIIILKIINEKIFGLTIDEIDKYIELIKTGNI